MTSPSSPLGMEQPMIPTSSTALAPSGANHCLFMFLLKDFQMMTWPVLWTGATAQTRRRVSGDLCTVVFFSSHGSGSPPAFRKSPVQSSAHLHGRGKRGLSHGNKGKAFGLPGHAWCQQLEVLSFDSVGALQLQLPPGQTGPVPPLSP